MDIEKEGKEVLVTLPCPRQDWFRSLLPLVNALTEMTPVSVPREPGAPLLNVPA